MIDPTYCRVMARYNAWQNGSVWAAVQTLDADALDLDRGAFFGSIRRTLNHLLWGDMIWISRFEGRAMPQPPAPPDGTELTPTISAWWAERFRTDGRIRSWADGVSALDLTGELHWHSKAMGGDVVKPVGLCVAGFFNHQTHHRGQVHAMLTAAGARPDDTDLVLMDDDGWL